MIPERLSAAKRRNTTWPSINYHIKPTKSLADSEKAAIRYVYVAVWQACYAAISNNVLEVCHEYKDITKQGLSYLKAKCEFGKSKSTEL